MQGDSAGERRRRFGERSEAVGSCIIPSVCEWRLLDNAGQVPGLPKLPPSRCVDRCWNAIGPHLHDRACGDIGGVWRQRYAANTTSFRPPSSQRRRRKISSGRASSACACVRCVAAIAPSGTFYYLAAKLALPGIGMGTRLWVSRTQRPKPLPT